MPAPDLSDVLPLTQGSLTLTGSSAGGPNLADTLTRVTGGAPIVVRNATRNVSTDSVTVTGLADLLLVKDAAVTVIAQKGTDGSVTLTARFVLIDGAPAVPPWRFSRSFPNLPAFASGQRLDKISGDTDALTNTLDVLALADAAFVISSAAGAVDTITGAALDPGLNFVARHRPSGLFGMMESLISGGAPLILHGPITIPLPAEATMPAPSAGLVRFPWQLPTAPPGILLRADLPLDLTIGSALRLGGACARLYCPTDATWATANASYPPYLAASLDLAIPSAEVSVELTALALGIGGGLSLTGLCEGMSLGRLDQLVDIAGGRDLASALPDDLRSAVAKLQGLTLEAVTLSLDANWRPLATGVTIGLPKLQTKVLPGFELDSLMANFIISDPFGANRAIAAMLTGQVAFGGVQLDVELDLPGLRAAARSTAEISIPLSRLLRQSGLPLPELPDLPVNQLQLEVASDGSYAVEAEIADAPPWTIALGPAGLTIKDVLVSTMRSGGTSTSQISGMIALNDVLTLGVNYTTPGDFVLRAGLPEVNLRQLIAALSNQALALPEGFDLTLSDTSVLIQKSGTAGLVFLLATTMDGVGTVAFEARHVASQGSWGFAAGIDLDAPTGSALPGLGALKAFEDLFHLDQLVVVAASFDDPAFQFPDLGAFAAPTLPSRTLQLPSQGGVLAGLNVHATWTIDTSKQQRLLQKFLGLGPSLGITLQVGKDPAADSRLYVSYQTKIHGMPLSCEFGAQMKNSEIALFLEGTLDAKIQGQPVEFQVVMAMLVNGAMFSGSMLGSVSFEGLTLSNLALVIGCDWEGLPSLGIACTLTVKSFSSALAVFFDSTDPSHSMVAGALSDLTLVDVVETFARTPAPAELASAMRQVALLDTKQFTIDGKLADDLDNLKLDLVSAAFSTNAVSLPTSSRDVLLVVGDKGKNWFLTDMSHSMTHYELAKQPDGTIRVMLNPQFYCVPQATNLGALQFNQGIFITARLKIGPFDATATVLVNPSQGILVDGALDPIIIWKPALFSVTSIGGKSGARVSLATFSRPEQTDATLRGPHFVIDGEVTLLGCSRAAFVTVSESGFQFELKGTMMPGITGDLTGAFDSLTNFSAGGGLQVGIPSIDLGPLGKITIATGVAATLDAGFDGSAVKAKVGGSFQFAGRQLQTATFDLDLDKGLAAIPAAITNEVTYALQHDLGDAGRWADAVGRGAVAGVGDIARTLRNTHHVLAADAARLMRTANQTAEATAGGLKSVYLVAAGPAAGMLRGAGYAADETGRGLKSAFNVAADQAAGMLRDAGYSADETGRALKSAFSVGSNDAAGLLKQAGYGVSDVGNALKSTYGTTAQQTANALKAAGYGIGDVGRTVKDTFDLGPDDLADPALKGAGYADDQIKGLFNDLGGKFKDFFGSILDKIKSI